MTVNLTAASFFNIGAGMRASPAPASKACTPHVPIPLLSYFIRQLIILIRDLPPEFFGQQHLSAGDNQLLACLDAVAYKISAGRCRILIYGAAAELLGCGFNGNKSL